MTAIRQRLDGWDQIRAYLRISRRHARRLAAASIPEDRRLPVFRLSDVEGARVHAYADELMAWEARMAQVQRVTSGE